MRIWYLNHYANNPLIAMPGRPYFLARVMRQEGHEVLIVAASFHHLGDPRQVPVEDQVVELAGQQYMFLPARRYEGNGLGRFLNNRDYVRGLDGLAQRVRRGELEPPDVVIPSSVHIFAYPPGERLARALGARLIFEVRDVWPLTLVEVLGWPAWHPLVLWMGMIERRAYRRADAVVSLLPNALEHMRPRGLDPKRFHYIPNGVLAAEWDKPTQPLGPEAQELFDRLRQQGKLIVVYAGAHGRPNNLGQVLDLAPLAGPGPAPYHFVFIGAGAVRDELMQRAQREGLDFVSFLPRMPFQQVRSALALADVGFVSVEALPIWRLGLSPNKLFDYCMSGKPVVFAVNLPDHPLNSREAGYTVPPNQPDILHKTLLNLVAMGPGARAAMGGNARRMVLEEHEWGVLGRTYARLCEGLAKDRR